jgi:hypothetical protein
MEQQESKLLEIIQRKAIDDKTAMTTYKVKDGGIVNVKSIFSNDKYYKDALFPAVLTTLKQHCEA